jgi:hypothetical protein
MRKPSWLMSPGRPRPPGTPPASTGRWKMADQAQPGGPSDLFASRRSPSRRTSADARRGIFESRTRSSLVNPTLALAVTCMPCADSSTISAHRQVITDPLPRRTTRTGRRPSSIIDLTHLRRSVTGPVSAITACRRKRGGRANVTCHGASLGYVDGVLAPPSTCRPPLWPPSLLPIAE